MLFFWIYLYYLDRIVVVGIIKDSMVKDEFNLVLEYVVILYV